MTPQVDTSTLERAVRLLSEYANSGVPDAVSLECAQVCGKLRDALAQPQPSATCQPNPETGDISPERVTSVDMSQPSASAGEVLVADAVILRARRAATHGLPEAATLDCGCNGVNLCRWAAQRYIDMWEGPPDVAQAAQNEFIEHQRLLSPRGPRRPRRTDIGMAFARLAAADAGGEAQ